MEKENKGGNQ